MYQKPQGPQPIGGVLDDGFSLFRWLLKTLFPIGFIGTLLMAPGQRAVRGALSDGFTSSAAIMTIGNAVFSIVVTLIMYIMMLHITEEFRHGRPVTYGQSWSVALRRAPLVFIVAVAYFLAIFIGMLFLVVPGIYLFVVFAFAPIVALFERRGFAGSFGYSFDLVRGRWWRTMVILTVMTIILSVLSLVLTFFSVDFDAAMSGAPQPQPWWVDYLLAPVVNGLMTPLAVTFGIAVYADNKIRLEGGDLFERVAAAEA